MFSTSASPKSIVDARGLLQLSDPKLIETVIDRVIASNPKQTEAFRAGKAQLFGFFVGQVMKETDGKASPRLVNELLEKKLKV